MRPAAGSRRASAAGVRAGDRRTRSRRRTAMTGSDRRYRPAARTARADRSSAPRGTRRWRCPPAAVESQLSAASVRGIREALDVRRSAAIVPAREVVVVRPRIRDRIRTGDRAETRRRGPAVSVARLPEVLRGGLDSGRQHESAVVPKAMAERRLAGEDRRVRRAGQWRMGNRGLEADAARGQGVERRSGGGLVSVAPDVVGSQRVDRHEQHIRRIGGACRAGVGRTAGDRPASA